MNVWVKVEGGQVFRRDPETPCRFPNGTYGPIKNAKYGDECSLGEHTVTIVEMKTWRVFTDVAAASGKEAIDKVWMSRDVDLKVERLP